MIKNTQTYDKVLNRFVYANQKVLAQKFGIDIKQAAVSDLKGLLTYKFGLELKEEYRVNGELGGRFLSRVLSDESELLGIPAKVARFSEINQATNKSLPAARSIMIDPPVAQAAAVGSIRLAKMRQAFQKLSRTGILVDRAVEHLIEDIKLHRRASSDISAASLRASARRLESVLRSAHVQARTAGVWALRSGFSEKSVASAVTALYLRPMMRLEKSMESLEQRCGSSRISLKFSSGISRRRRVMARELMDLHAVMPHASPDIQSKQEGALSH